MADLALHTLWNKEGGTGVTGKQEIHALPPRPDARGSNPVEVDGVRKQSFRADFFVFSSKMNSHDVPLSTCVQQHLFSPWRRCGCGQYAVGESRRNTATTSFVRKGEEA